MNQENTSHDVLIHYGILGQKWGVRRYQNEDGSLTSEGRQRYGGMAPSNRQIKKMEKMDQKWFKKNHKSVEKYARKSAKKEINKETKRIDKKWNKDPLMKEDFHAADDKRISELQNMRLSILNRSISDLKTPSGRAVEFCLEHGNTKLTLTDSGSYEVVWVNNK